MKCYPIEERDGYAIICLLIFVIHQLSLLTQLKNHDCCCDSCCAWPPTPLHTQEGILRQHIGTFSKSTLVTVSYEKSHALSQKNLSWKYWIGGQTMASTSPSACISRRGRRIRREITAVFFPTNCVDQPPWELVSCCQYLKQFCLAAFDLVFSMTISRSQLAGHSRSLPAETTRTRPIDHRNHPLMWLGRTRLSRHWGPA